MGSLKDELIKAGLLSKDRAKQIDHEKRVQKKKKPRAERQQESEQKKKRFEAERAEKKSRDKALNEAAQDEKAARRELTSTRQQILSNALRKIFGPRTFFVVTREGRIPSLQVADGVARDLESGRLAVVENPENRHDLLVVPGELAQRLRSLDAEAVRFFNG